LKNGDRVASDCLYISGNGLRIDNSQETGENRPVVISNAMPFVLSGAAVESGEGHVLVCAVGSKTQFGLGMSKMHTDQEPHSPLEEKIEKLSKRITIIGGIGSLIVFIALLIEWIVHIMKVKWEREFIYEILEDVMVGLTVSICAVPEGLPLSVIFTLGLSMKWMVKDNIFVRHLTACETMGGATAICSDKTGTLTENHMTVVKFFMGGKDHEGYPELSPDLKQLLSEAIAVNTTAYQNPSEDDTPGKFVGLSSECALLQMLPGLGADYRQIREEFPARIRHEFNSTRKRMSTVIWSGDHFRVYVKGAPDLVLDRCTQYMHEDGSIHELTTEIRNGILDRAIDMANDALRTILIGFADLESLQQNSDWEDPGNVETDLTMIGIAGIIDPVRPEVPHSIELCRRAGVTVRMVTGDYINTAKAVARQCGILTDDGAAITGMDFSSMSKLELLALLPKLQVIARSSPLDKYRLVGLLMEAGEIVAVTGDGSNDAPAMKRANCGIAMGQYGTELAKMASDIVILDDDFSLIVVALKCGRATYDNVRSYATYQTTVNCVAITIAFIGALALGTPLLKAIQLLWTNLIVGAIRALALATHKQKNS
jgi:Ca2+-transporting ATPase